MTAEAPSPDRRRWFPGFAGRTKNPLPDLPPGPGAQALYTLPGGSH